MTPGGGTVCFCYEQEVRMKTNMLATSSLWQCLINTFMLIGNRKQTSGKAFKI